MAVERAVGRATRTPFDTARQLQEARTEAAAAAREEARARRRATVTRSRGVARAGIPSALEPRATANSAENTKRAARSKPCRLRSVPREAATQRRKEPDAASRTRGRGGRGVELAQETRPPRRPSATARRLAGTAGDAATERAAPAWGKPALRAARRVPGDADGGGSQQRAVVPRGGSNGARWKAREARRVKRALTRRVRLLGADVTERCTITNLELTASSHRLRRRG